MTADTISEAGSLDKAIAYAANYQHDPRNDTSDMLADLLAEQSRRAELADPGVHYRALLRQACDLEARAERSAAEGAEYAGKAAARRLQGEAKLADNFQRMADARERYAADLMEQAFGLKLQAADIRASMDFREAFVGICNAIPGVA